MLGSEKIKILHVNIKENEVIQIEAEANAPVSEAEIARFKEEICEKLGYEQVVLDLRQPEPAPAVSDPTVDSFWEEYLSDLRLQSPSLWALLTGSRLYDKGDAALAVYINKNLGAILKMKQADRLIASAFTARFGRQVSAEFIYLAQETEARNTEKRDTVAVPFSVEQYQASVQHAAGAENSYTRVYGGGQGRGFNRGDGKSSKRRRLTPEEGAALPKDAEGCEIILGKAITDPITLMKDVSSDSGYVAVKGKVTESTSSATDGMWVSK